MARESVTEFFKPHVPGLGYVESHEEAEATALILDEFEKLTGFRDMPRPCGYMVAVRLWIPSEKVINAEGKDTGLFRPMSNIVEQKYQSPTGLVVAKGPDCYTGERFAASGPWCRIGDFVMIPRYEAVFCHYRGVAMVLVPDDKILAVVIDPSIVSAVHNDTVVN